MRKYSIILLVFIIAIAGCTPSPFYQKEYSVPQNAWSYSFKPTFKFDIPDSTVDYNLDFLIRHTEAYPYANIWLWVYIKQPGMDSFQRSRIEIPLAQASGKWMGKGMGEIWEQRMPVIVPREAFKRKGTYEIRLEQNMRVNPLPEILHVGLRVEKVGQNSRQVQ